MKNNALLKTSQLQTLVNNVFQLAKENPSGFTLNLNSLQLVTNGYVSAYKETQNSFGLDGLKNVIKHALLIGATLIGGWYNADNGQYYFDCSRVFDNLTDAAIFGLENEQIAIFDLNENRDIKIS